MTCQSVNTGGQERPLELLVEALERAGRKSVTVEELKTVIQRSK